MSPASTVPMHGRDHLEHGADPIRGLLPDQGGASFPDAIYALAETKTLIGYWRLGEGAEPYLDTSGYAPSDPAPLDIEVGGTAMTQDVTPGALATQDDGAVAFNSSTGASAENLEGVPAVEVGRFNYGGATEQTILAWVKPSASASTFLGVIAASSDSTKGWGVFLQWPARTLLFKRRQGTSGTITTVTGPILPADTWSFVAATYSPTNGHRLYLNDTLEASDAATNTLTGINIGMKIGGGAGGVGATGSDFYGAIDEVSAWLAELTLEEITALATAGVGGGGAEPGSVLISDGAGGTSWGQVTSASIEDDTIVDADVSATADIDPAKLEHPGGTTMFLRADGTWALPISDPADDPAVWLPLSTVVAGVPELVWDGDDQLIPTLTPI